jgi:hypothetical protein
MFAENAVFSTVFLILQSQTLTSKFCISDSNTRWSLRYLLEKKNEQVFSSFNSTTVAILENKITEYHTNYIID